MIGFDLHTASDIVYNGNTVNSVWFRGTLIWPPNTPPPTPTDWSTEYLQVEAQQYMTLSNTRPLPSDTSNITRCVLDIQYSVDKVNWYSWNRNISIRMNAGDIVYFKGSYSSYFDTSKTPYDYQLIWSTETTYFGGVVRGNVMSLLYGDNFVGQTSLAGYDRCFYWLFEALQLVDASNIILPATTLSNNCYEHMFYKCWSLTSAPELPATTLTEHCYTGMFQECKNLVDAPDLPATTLAQYCYSGMFSYCRSLINPPALPATTLPKYCYQSMFGSCTSLEIAPVLPATTLADYCYDQMFSGCTSLNYIKCLAPSISWYNTTSWTYNVASSGTFVKHPDATWRSGVDGIPLGWSVQNA